MRIDFSEVGLPDQWAITADIGLLSPRQFRKIQALATDNSQEGAKAFFGRVVTAWHVLDPETGEALPDPTDPALDLEAVPLRVTSMLNQNITDQLANILPKG